jgi:hypothetical protein
MKHFQFSDPDYYAMTNDKDLRDSIAIVDRNDAIYIPLADAKAFAEWLLKVANAVDGQ